MKTSLRLILLAASALLAGCATPSDPMAMVPATAQIQKTHHGCVSIAVSGGRGTNPLWTSQVSDKDFATALQTSLERHRVFSRVIQAGDGDYRLEVALVRMKQPLAGFDMTVTADTQWKLTSTRSGKVVWQETLSRAHTATVGDAFVGITRLKMANEGAIRESIKAGIERISRVST